MAELQCEQRFISNTLDDLAENWLKDCDKRLQHPGIPGRISKKDIAPSIGGLALSQVNPLYIRAAIKRLLQLAKFQVDHITVHELLRTCRRLLAAKSVPGHVSERCLNRTLKGVDAIYDRYDFLKKD